MTIVVTRVFSRSEGPKVVGLATPYRAKGGT